MEGIRPAYEKSNIIFFSPYPGYMGLCPGDGVFPGTAYLQDFSEVSFIATTIVRRFLLTLYHSFITENPLTKGKYPHALLFWKFHLALWRNT